MTKYVSRIMDEVYDNIRNHFDDKDEKIWFLEELIFELKDEYRYPLIEPGLMWREFRFYNKCDREMLKVKCRQNGIEYKERTPTKILIKKLMSL